MALLIKLAFQSYSHVNNDLADPRTKEWPMVKSPIQVIVLLVGYLLFVRHVGPNYMKNRKAFNIDKILIVYNACQVLLCSYLVYRLIPPCWRGNVFCEEVTDSEHSTKVAHTSYIYFLVKILDLTDTVFFVLRKNQRQVTFLHVYHHSLLITYTWYVVKFVPGGQFIYVGLVNSFVHVLMYSYYLLTVFNPAMKKSVWWKKHITQLQLFQFFLYSILFFLPLTRRNCGFPKSVCMMVLPQVSMLTFLFADFYYKTYSRNDVDENSKNGNITQKGSKVMQNGDAKSR